MLVPGLGCLVEGWVMSPVRGIEGLRLRAGGVVMVAELAGLYWKARPDILATYPDRGGMVGRAGFVGLFAGDAQAEDCAEAVLKVVFREGGSANWAVSPALFRRLGHSASLEDALRFFRPCRRRCFFLALPKLPSLRSARR